MKLQMKLAGICLFIIAGLQTNAQDWMPPSATSNAELWREGKVQIGVDPLNSDPNDLAILLAGQSFLAPNQTGHLLGHMVDVQGIFGDHLNFAQWAGIGHYNFAPLNTGEYGMRTQWNRDFYALMLDDPANPAGRSDVFFEWGSDPDNRVRFQFLGDPTNQNIRTDVMSVNGNGNVGVGTIDPTTRLQAWGGAISVGEDIVDPGDVGTGSSVGIMAVARTMGGWSNISTPGDFVVRGTTWRAHTILAAANLADIKFETNGAEQMTITADGDVGIGTATPLTDFQVDGRTFIGDGTGSFTCIDTDTDFMLWVETGIRTERVRVDAQAGWCDYVFEPDYNRLSIAEVKDFVQREKHLPNVPSAEEVMENGIDVAEMDATMIRQIEELWLHMIDLKEENEALRKEIQSLKQ